MRVRNLIPALVLCAGAAAQISASSATLLLEEPYSYDGQLAGTGHAAVYLSGVCADTPVHLRQCQPGETGVVISRYHGVTQYDWVAIPLIPYLYAVEKQEDVPLYADPALVNFLRDRYRRDHLEAVAPDRSGGKTPEGDWYEFVGESYLRTIYAYQIETRPEQDEELIRRLNDRPNRQAWKLVTANCADFARKIIDFYHPHAVHRSIIADLGVTTPKQDAFTLSRYIRHHSEFQSAQFIIPQVPGALPRSKPVHGVLECALTQKKYMLPALALHPFVAGGLLAAYIGHGHFDPSKDMPVLDAQQEPSETLTKADRRDGESRLREMTQVETILETGEEASWKTLRENSTPGVDSDGEPLLEVRAGGEVTPLGVTRDNILNAQRSEFAAALMTARLHEELKPAAARKTARADVERDFFLLQQLLQDRQELAASFSTRHTTP